MHAEYVNQMFLLMISVIARPSFAITGKKCSLCKDARDASLETYPLFGCPQ